MTTKEEIQAAIDEIGLTVEQARDNKYLGGVYSLFEDGEISYEKGGDLLGMRTIHCFEGGDDRLKPLQLTWKAKMNGFNFIHADPANKDKLYAIRAAMFNHPGSNMPYNPLMHSSYLERVFDKPKRQACIAQLLEDIKLRNLNFDAIAARGVSGIPVAAILAHLLDKELVVVRKHEEHSHADVRVEQPPRPFYRYLIVDDFISSGKTIFTIIANIATNTPLELPPPICVGVMEYHHDCSRTKFNDRARLRELFQGFLDDCANIWSTQVAQEALMHVSMMDGQTLNLSDRVLQSLGDDPGKRYRDLSLEQLAIIFANNECLVNGGTVDEWIDTKYGNWTILDFEANLNMEDPVSETDLGYIFLL